MLDDHAMEYKQHGWVAANELNAAGAALRDVRRIPPKRDVFSSGRLRHSHSNTSPGAHAFRGRFRVLGDAGHWRGGVASNMLNQAQ